MSTATQHANVVESIERWLARFEFVLVAIALVCAVAMMCLTTADAVSRYVLNSPIIGAYEITEKYLIVGMVFFGLSYAYRGGAFIRITFLVARLPYAARLAANYAAQVVSVLFCILLVVATLEQARRVHANGTTLSAVELPLGPAYFLVPVGLFFLSALVLIDVLHVRSGRSHLFTESTSDS